jgi:hypothetical protein
VEPLEEEEPVVEGTEVEWVEQLVVPEEVVLKRRRVDSRAREDTATLSMRT